MPSISLSEQYTGYQRPGYRPGDILGPDPTEYAIPPTTTTQPAPRATPSFGVTRGTTTYGRAGGRGGGRGDLTGSVSTTTPIAPEQALPTFGDVPIADEARIKRLTQTRSAAGQRALRTALRESLLQASYQENPNVAALIGRKALAGFGQGVAEVFTRAQREATTEEARDRQFQFAKQQAVFNASMQDYMRRFGTTTQREQTFDGQTAEEGRGTYVRGARGSLQFQAETPYARYLRERGLG